MKKHALYTAATAFLMLALPGLTVRFVKGDAGMAVCFLLFFAVDPLWSAALGLFAGRDVKKRFFVPIIPAVLFLAGTRIFFDRGEKAFIFYAAVYLLLGTAAMLLSALLRKKRE